MSRLPIKTSLFVITNETVYCFFFLFVFLTFLAQGIISRLLNGYAYAAISSYHTEIRAMDRASDSSRAFSRLTNTIEEWLFLALTRTAIPIHKVHIVTFLSFGTKRAGEKCLEYTQI